MPNLANPAPPLPSFPDQSAASNPLPQQPSPPSHRVLKIARPVTLGLALFLSIPVLGLCAHILSVTTDNIIIDFYFIFTALGVATAVLTIVSVGGLLFWNVAIWLELLMLGILWVLWVATAAETGNANSLIGFSNCSALFSEFVSICHEFTAVEGLSVLVCILISLYISFLVIYAIRASSAGLQGTWSYSAKHHTTSRTTTQEHYSMSQA